MFPAILLSFDWGSGWDQLLYVITELPASLLTPVPRFDPLCMGACKVQPLGKPSLMSSDDNYITANEIELNSSIMVKQGYYHALRSPDFIAGIL